MLKLHQHIVRDFLLVFMFTLICGAFVSYFTLRNIYISNLKDEIKSNINIIKLQMPTSQNAQNLSTFAKDIKQKTKMRTTFISSDGTVLAESDFEPKSMDNHLFRPEILMANEQEFGDNLRHSDTLEVDFLYVANEFLFDGKSIYIRLAISTESLRKNFMALWEDIMLVFIGALIIVFILSYNLNKKMQLEIKKLSLGLQDIANKEYKSKIQASFAQEFVDISQIVHTLSQKLAKRDKQKRKHTAKLKLLSKQRTQTLSAISHEFKNPIAAIIGYASTLLEDENANKAIRKRFLGKILNNGHKITNMIDRLSLSTKLENNDLAPNFSTFDLSDLTKDVVDGFKTRYPNRDFEIVLKPTKVKADIAMIEMVINNLLDNAIKYSKSSVHVEVKNQECKITDKGEGIDEKEISEVTKKFYRSKRLTWDNSMGLGLSLVEYMLKLHDTKLHIKSKIGKGSTFSFNLKA